MSNGVSVCGRAIEVEPHVDRIGALARGNKAKQRFTASAAQRACRRRSDGADQGLVGIDQRHIRWHIDATEAVDVLA